MSSSRVSELKRLFERNSSMLTPEQHALALRTKERDQKEAIKIAKSRAARYNLRLRSMELQSNSATAQAIAAAHAKEGQASAPPPPVQRAGGGSIYNRKSGYGNDSSNIPQSAASLAKIEASQALVAEAMNEGSNPETAIKALDFAAKSVERAVEEEVEEKKRAEVTVFDAAYVADTSPPPPPSEEAVVVVAVDEPPPEKGEEEASSSKVEGATFEMVELVRALESDDANAINKAVVVEFLQEHDPNKVANVDEMLQAHVGTEDALMTQLAEQYADPVEVEIKAIAREIANVEEEEDVAKAAVVVEEEEQLIGAVEAQRREAERIKMEEEAKLAAMDDAEKLLYLEKLNAQAKHNEDKDRMLKSQLNVYGTGGAAALLSAGRGRGRGKPKPQQEYIVNAAYQKGKWEVNPN